MASTTTNPAEGQSAGLGNLSCVGRCDGSRDSSHASKNQDRRIAKAKLALLRDALHEALAFARIYAETAQSFAEIGDDTLALESLSRFHHAATSACMAGREIRELRREARQ